MNFIEGLQKLLPWLSGLQVAPKIVISVIIILAATFILLLIWSPNPPQQVKENDVPQEVPLIEQKLCGALWHKEEPLPGVVVTIQELNQQTQTDTQGRFCFTIKAVKEDKVRLMAQKAGFETLLEDATLGNTNLAYKMNKKQ